MKDSLICHAQGKYSEDSGIFFFFFNLVCHFATLVKKKERKPVMILFLTAVESLELGRLKARS